MMHLLGHVVSSVAYLSCLIVHDLLFGYGFDLYVAIFQFI